MNEATAKQKVDIRLDQVPDPPEVEDDFMGAESQLTGSPAARTESEFESTAELVSHTVVGCNRVKYPVPNQPAGVFAAISKEANGFIETIMEAFDKTQLGAIEVLEKGAASFGAEGEVADAVEKDALKTVVKKTIPKIIELLAKDAPEFLAKVVAMILEPDASRIREGKALTHKPEDILWNLPVDQQVKAVSLYIDSLNLGALKKKVRSFREA